MKTRYSLLAILVIALTVTGLSDAADLIGISWDTGDLYSVSPSNASLTLIGNTGVTAMGSLELYSDGFLYAFTLESGATLYQINPSSAAVSPIGPLNIGFVYEGGLAFDPNGVAYATNQDHAGNPVLFTVNMSTGQGTLIGTISGGPHDVNGLAWRSDGKLVGLDRESNSLLQIDPATAASSVVGTLSPTVGVVGGMTVLHGTGYLATSGPGGSGPGESGSNELWSFDLFTGDHSLVGGLGPTISGTGMSGLAVPEPATLSLLALGALALIRRKR